MTSECMHAMLHMNQEQVSWDLVLTPPSIGMLKCQCVFSGNNVQLMTIEDCQIGIRAGCCDNARLDAKRCSNSSCIRNCTTLQLFHSLTICFVQRACCAESLWCRQLCLPKPFSCLQYRLSSCPQAELGFCSPKVPHTTLSSLILHEHRSHYSSEWQGA